MANYELRPYKKGSTILHSKQSCYSDEYIGRMCDLHLHDEIYADPYGHTTKYYRLHANHPHTIEDALAYDIYCPSCNSRLKQVGRCINSRELGLYICPACNRK